MSFNQFLEGLWWSLLLAILILAARDEWRLWRERRLARSLPPLAENEERLAGRL